ncbi:hypothetical protein MK163_19345 [bacterium]|nr:hypothetical protein [bacterium]
MRYCVLYFICPTLVSTVHHHWWRTLWLRRLVHGQFPGHWLPFRFGCPPGAPRYTLHRA